MTAADIAKLTGRELEFRAAVREPVAKLFGVHPDDLTTLETR